jgi:hypothetical protein
MLLVYAAADHAFYRRVVFCHYIFFTIGCSLCSPIAYGLYAASSFASAFYATAAFAFIAGALLFAYFASRMASTSVGILGSFAAAEEELRQRAALRTSAPIGPHAPSSTREGAGTKF